jgi:hypothetical protein
VTFQRFGFFLSFCIAAQGCVMVQISQKENILSRTEQKSERRENRRLAATLKDISYADSLYTLRFAVGENVTVTERRYFEERIRAENQLTEEGKRLKYFVSWISFAFEEEGAGSYFLYMLGGIPMTLGVNIPVALYDWGSLPFRLGDKTAERIRYDDQIVTKSEEATEDCTRFAIRIFKQDFPLSRKCLLVLGEEAFEALAQRHNFPPRFPGAFRYELVEIAQGEIRMGSQVFMKSFPMRQKSIGFLERH